MRMLEEIGDLSEVDAVIERKMANKEKIMGFGHRVYKAYDPRATYLKTFAKGLAEDTGNLELYEMSNRIEEIMNEKVAAKGLQAGPLLRAICARPEEDPDPNFLQTHTTL